MRRSFCHAPSKTLVLVPYGEAVGTKYRSSSERSLVHIGLGAFGSYRGLADSNGSY